MVANDNDLLLTGTTEADVVITIYDGSIALGTTNADGNGAWSFQTGIPA